MALLSIFRGTQAECSARPVSDGTLLFATDTKNIYLDKDSSRIEMSSVDDLGDYVTKEQLTTALSGKANSSHTHTKSQITDFPSSLKNPNSLTISLNGTSQGAYDGSAAKSINVTPASIGAAASSHNHSAANITSGTLSTDRLPTVPIAHGGTGATDAAGARANLGLYQNPATIGDCNSAPAGFSFYTTGTANRPTDFGHLITFDGANWKFQIALGTYDGMWWRQNINNDGWTKWSQLANNPTSMSYYCLTPVYRLYNSYDKMFLFTVSTSEYNDLVSKGWTGNGIAFYAFR